MRREPGRDLLRFFMYLRTPAHNIYEKNWFSHIYTDIKGVWVVTNSES
jgi:hypothetical protein